MKRYIAGSIAVIAAFTLVFAIGCSREKTIKTDEGTITFSKDGGKFEIKTDKGTMSITDKGLDIKTKEGNAVMQLGEKSTIPPNIARDVPLYEPSTVTMTQMLGDGDKFMLGLSTKDDSAKVADFYKKELSENGWRIGNTMNMGPSTVMQGMKGEKKLNVTINQADEATIISVAYTAK